MLPYWTTPRPFGHCEELHNNGLWWWCSDNMIQTTTIDKCCKFWNNILLTYRGIGELEIEPRAMSVLGMMFLYCLVCQWPQVSGQQWLAHLTSHYMAIILCYCQGQADVSICCHQTCCLNLSSLFTSCWALSMITLYHYSVSIFKTATAWHRDNSYLGIACYEVPSLQGSALYEAPLSTRLQGSMMLRGSVFYEAPLSTRLQGSNLHDAPCSTRPCSLQGNEALRGLYCKVPTPRCLLKGLLRTGTFNPRRLRQRAYS